MNEQTTNRPQWKPSFKQRLVLARSEAYEVSTTYPKQKRPAARARFWVRWIKCNAMAGGKA